jgi:hypothetical protein
MNVLAEEVGGAGALTLPTAASVLSRSGSGGKYDS